MHILPFQFSDLIYLNNLRPEGWADISPAFEFYLKSHQAHPIKVLDEDIIVGLGAAVVHNEVAWLAHIIVHPKWRNQGIGSLITNTLIQDAHKHGCNTLSLIATDMGAPVYAKLGFETETEYLFYKDIEADSTWEIPADVIVCDEQHCSQIIDMDLHVSGEERQYLLKPHLADAYVFARNGKVEGYYLPSLGEGLINAQSTEAGIELMKLRLQTHNNAAFPIENKVMSAFFVQLGCQPFKQAKRMVLGPKRNWQGTQMYNRIGGNLG